MPFHIRMQRLRSLESNRSEYPHFEMIRVRGAIQLGALIPGEHTFANTFDYIDVEEGRDLVLEDLSLCSEFD